MMKKWNFNEVVNAFVRENKKILDLSFYETGFENKSFDLVTSSYIEYDIAEIARIVKKGGHFITEQYSYGDVNHQGDNPKFNLENQVEKFSDFGFSMIKSNQQYQKNNETINHEFYMVLKKNCDTE